MFAHIILTMMALVFMFMGVKVAANHDPVTQAAFKPFASLGESVGNFVAHSPSYLPLPHPAFAAITNPGAVADSISMSVKNQINQEHANIGKSLADMTGGKYGEFKKAANDVKSAGASIESAARRFADLQDKSPKEARQLILDGIKNASQDTQDNPEVKALVKAVEEDSRGEGLARILEDHADALKITEADTKTK